VYSFTANNAHHILRQSSTAIALFKILSSHYSNLPPPFLYQQHHAVEIKRKGDKGNRQQEDPLKYFIGGLDHSISSKDLGSYFASIGVEVLVPQVMMHEGKSR
jgi:hypothetical protein